MSGKNDQAEKSQSSITLAIVTGDRYLNGCLNKQYRCVDLIVNDPSGREMARVTLSMDQFAHMLVSNSQTPCTLTRYRDDSGKMQAERPTPPESVQARLAENMGRTTQELKDRIADIKKDVYDMVNGGPVGKKALRELLHEIDVLKGHFESNVPYMVQKAQEEASKIQDNLRVQLSTLLTEQTGVQVATDTIRRLEGIADDTRLLTPSEARPVETGYEKKDRSAKSIEDMTSMEVADHLNALLKRLERADHEARQAHIEKYGSEPKDGARLFNCGASEAGANHVSICYISYQTRNKVALDEAKDYLRYLRGVKSVASFRQHWHYKNGAKGD